MLPSATEGSSCAAPEDKNQNVLMDIVLNDTETSVIDTNTAILESAL